MKFSCRYYNSGRCTNLLIGDQPCAQVSNKSCSTKIAYLSIFKNLPCRHCFYASVVVPGRKFVCKQKGNHRCLKIMGDYLGIRIKNRYPEWLITFYKTAYLLYDNDLIKIFLSLITAIMVARYADGNKLGLFIVVFVLSFLILALILALMRFILEKSNKDLWQWIEKEWKKLND